MAHSDVQPAGPSKNIPTTPFKRILQKSSGSGRLEFRPVNVEEPGNKHFIQDHQLVTKSLVLSLVSDGKETKSNNLADVWKLVRDKDKFFQYVKDEVEKFPMET